MVKRKKAKVKPKKARPRARKVAGRSKTRKPKARKTGAKRAKAKTVRAPESTMEKIGEVTHYFPHVNAAAVLMLKNSLKVGEAIYIKGHTTDFKEKVASIQLDRVPIQEGKKGQEIGLLVRYRVRIGDSVYKV